MVRIALVLMAFALPAHADALEDLMLRLAQVKSARGKFVERKELAMLNAPLESSGTLVYAKPGRLEKHMLEPRRESMILDGDTLTLEDKDRGQVRSFAVQENPVLWGFVESIRSTLSGDLATLKRFYEVRLEGAGADWHLRLRPTDRRMQKAAKEIRVSGSGTWVSTIEIDEAGGDHSVMTIRREAP
ncbi:MAG TPA: outer membrane lipoprotein carrier protein LolA [Burkholderiales bacterium]|jgi:outer membrane lipoprotein-sorting protein